MTPQNAAVIEVLEPLILAARHDVRESVRLFGLSIFYDPNRDHDLADILKAITWHAEQGYRGERQAFAHAAERLVEVSS